MTRRIRHALLLTMGTLGSLAPPAAAAPPAPRLQEPAQDPAGIADKRPEVAELRERFEKHVAQRGDEDDKAIEVVDLLLVEFPRSGPKDRAAIASTISSGLEARRSAEEVVEEEEVREKANNQLYLACAVALGEMGPESVADLMGWIGHKRHRADLELQRRLILSLGKTRDAKGVRPLTDLLTHKDAVLVAAAAEALAQHENASEDTRKKIFAELLEALMTAKGAMDSDVNDTIARERYNTFSAAIITSLGRLSGHDERDPDAWLRWWNNNKREKWGPERS